jgi:DNA-binding transcriptional regulator YiaG
MPTVLPTLNEHIRRLARREIRSETRKSRKAGAQHRRDIAALKRLVKNLSTRLAQIERTASRALPAEPPAREIQRFRSDGLRTHRAKLGLSARDYGRLLGVSGLTIYHWEGGKSRPRPKHLPLIAQVRTLGKREAQRRLEQL